MILSELLTSRAETMPEAVAFEFWSAGEVVDRLTYAQLQAAAHGSARRFLAAGSQRRPIMLLHPPGLDFIVDFFGCLYAGSAAVPSPPPTHERDKTRFSALIDAAQPAIAATSARSVAPQTLQKWHSDWPEIPFLAFERDFAQATIPCGGNPDEPAVLQFTSGSTSSPRGVILSHRAILCNLAQIHSAFDFRSSERHEAVVLWLPHFHDMGLFGRLECIFAACQGHLMSPVEFVKRPMRWLQLITQTHATVTGAPNFAFDLCASETLGMVEALDLSSLRIAFCGAEPVNPHALDRFEAAYRGAGLSPDAITPCYGLAEATLMVSSHVPGQRRKAVALAASALEAGRVVEATDTPTKVLCSCGTVVSGLEVAIVDPHSHTATPPRKVGEIWIRGPNVTAGYVGDSDRNLSFARRHDEAGQTRPYLRTGDLGFFRDGELFVVGRIKDIIIVHGRNFHPHDLERATLQSHAALQGAKAAAVAVETAHGERPAILIEVPRALENRLSVLKQAIDAIREDISAQFDFDPARIVIARRGAIVFTTSGKIAHAETARRLRDGAIEAIYEWPEPRPGVEGDEASVEAAILRIVSEVLGRPVREALLGFKAIGGDSLAAHRVAARLRTAYGNAFDESELLLDVPIRDIAFRLDERLAEQVALLTESEAANALAAVELQQTFSKQDSPAPIERGKAAL